MIPTPADRELMQAFVAVMDDPTTPTIAQGKPDGLTPAKSDTQWELAALLVAVARRTGWAPKEPLTP